MEFLIYEAEWEPGAGEGTFLCNCWLGFDLLWMVTAAMKSEGNCLLAGRPRQT